MSKKFTCITGAAAPMLQVNIDTDTIAPAIRKSRVGQKLEFNERDADDLAKNLFAGWRYDDKDNELPDFVLNKPGFRETKIILAGDNFACGSSRESANWMLADFGIRVIVAPSYGEIFYNNCFKNGILPIELDAQLVDRLFEEMYATEGYELKVDLERQVVETPSGEVIRFEVDAFRKHCLLNGLDDIALTLESADAIRAYEQSWRKQSPWLFDAMG